MITLLPVLALSLRPRGVAASIWILPEENPRYTDVVTLAAILRVFVISLNVTVRVVKSLCSVNLLLDMMIAERIFFRDVLA